MSFTIYQQHQEQSAKLSDYEGKVVIFDFWNTHCPSCIAKMPEIHALQQQLQEKVQFIYVTENTKEEIDGLFSRIAGKSEKSDALVQAGYDLPFIYKDELIHRAFPHKGWGLQVWIDVDRVYQYLAYPETTTYESLSAFHQGKRVNLKEQKLLSISRADPITWLRSTSESDATRYSFIIKRIEASGFGLGRNQILFESDSITHQVTGLNAVNQTIIDLYRKAYGEGRQMELHDLHLEVADSNRYFNMHNDQIYWFEDNTYCYALSCPPMDTTGVYAVMRGDLDRYLDVNSFYSKRMTRHVVLKRLDNRFSFKADTNRIPKMEPIVKDEKGYLDIQNEYMSNLVNILSPLARRAFGEFTTFVDESGYAGKIDLVVPWGIAYTDYHPTFAEIRTALQKYGLDLVEEYREKEVLVLQEKGFASASVD